MPRSRKPPIGSPISAGNLEATQLPAPARPSLSEPAPVARAPIVIQFPGWRTLAKAILVALAIYAIVWLFSNAISAMTPFIIGLVLAYLLLPIVNRLDRSFPRPLAILTVYAGVIVVLIVGANYIIPPLVSQFQELIDNLPSGDQLLSTGDRLLQGYRRLVPVSFQAPIEQGVQSAIRTAQANATTYIQGVGSFALNQAIQVINTVTFLIGFLIIPFWLFYILNDQAKGSAFINRILHPRIRSDFWNVWRIINHVLSSYIRGQLLLGLAVGGMVGAGLLFLRLIGFDVRYILLLALLAGLTELVPIIGPILGAIPGVLLGFFGSENGVQTGLAVLAVYVLVQQLENSLLVPRIIGGSIGLHEAVLTVVLIAMGQVFGLLGVVLAAPVAAIGRDLFLYLYRRFDGSSSEAAIQSISADDQPQPAKQPA